MTISNSVGELYPKSLLQFQPIIATTWKWLEDGGYVDSVTPWDFKLTSRVWVESLKVIGRLCDDKMKNDLGLICGSLKDRLKRTQGPALVGTHEVAGECGLPVWFIRMLLAAPSSSGV